MPGLKLLSVPDALRPGRPSLALAPLRSSGASTSALAVALGRARPQEGLRVQACGKVSRKVSRRVSKEVSRPRRCTGVLTHLQACSELLLGEGAAVRGGELGAERRPLVADRLQRGVVCSVVRCAACCRVQCMHSACGTWIGVRIGPSP